MNGLEVQVGGVREGNRDVDHKYAHFETRRCNMYAYDTDKPVTRIMRLLILRP